MPVDEIFDDIQQLLSGTYICSDPLHPEYGVHTTFYKLPLDFLEKGFQQLLQNANARLGDVEHITHPDQQHILPPQTTMVRAYGYWDTLAIKYTDDFATIADGGRLNSALAEKSFYGYLLATNSGATADGLIKAPLREIHRLGQGATGEYQGAVFSHFKINPLLLYSGRTDLLIHAAKFISLVFAAPEELWDRPVMRALKGELLENFGADRRAAVADNLDRILPKISRLTRGAKFLIFQDLDWNDFSCYVAAKSIRDAVNISSFIRSLPLLMPNLAFRLSVETLQQLGPNEKARAARRKAKGGKDLRELTRLILNQESLAEVQGPRDEPQDEPNEEEKRRRARRRAYELPVFWSHVDTVAPPQVGIVDQLDVQLAEIINAKPGQTRRLLEEQGNTVPTDDLEPSGYMKDDLSGFFALSGPKDLFRSIGKEQGRVVKAEQRPWAAQKWTYVFSPIDLDLLYEGPEDIHHLCDKLGILLSQEFNKEDDWDELNSMLGELGTPRQLTFSIRHLVLTHLAYKNDALMFNALYDYQHLWSNLKESIEETIETRKIKPESADVRGLLSSMSAFAERVGQAINTRYHGTSRMFEVRDLSLNHRGGVDSFLDAYAQLVRASLDACKHIHHRSHHGIVNVTATPWPRILPLFGCVVELDWLRLSNPETLFVVLHELGHQVLSDKVFGLVRQGLPKASPTWRKVLIDDWKDTERELNEAGPFLNDASKVFSDVFCDLFMLHVLRGAVDQEEGWADSLEQFYDKWFWMMFECHLQQTKSIGEKGQQAGLMYTAATIIRWYIVRQVVSSWKSASWVDGNMEALVTTFAEGINHERPQNPSEAKAFRDKMMKLSKTIDDACEHRIVSLPLPDQMEVHLEGPLKYSPSVVEASRRALEVSEDELELADIVSAGLNWYFRSDEENVSPAQHFVSLSELLLTVFVDCNLRDNPTKSENLRVLGQALKYCQKIFEHSLDACTEARPCYALFHEGGDNPGSIQDAPYTDVVINSRGTPYARGGKLRLELFGERLAIFNQLAEGHLQSIVRELLQKGGQPVHER